MDEEGQVNKTQDVMAQQEDSVEDRIRATLYGNCIGDAIGLLTEFMSKQQAESSYGQQKGSLEYCDKIDDGHRCRWEVGDWTDDSDQMILIMKSLLDNHGHTYGNWGGCLEYELKVTDRHRKHWKVGDWTDDSDQMILIMQSLLENKGKVFPVDYGKRVKYWGEHGFAELGDYGGCGIGATTYHVLSSPVFNEDPHAAAQDIWERSGQMVAPNGAVMRTSVLGAYMYHDMEAVIKNTLDICKVTHADPRCQASCVAVTSAIAMMLQKKHMKPDGKFDIDKIMEESFQLGVKCFSKDWKHHIPEMRKHMFADEISDLQLDERSKIGYTFKCMGAGFWAFRQDDFRAALEAIVFEAGDADTNGAVAGALLGCKLGLQTLQTTCKSWLDGLLHKDWLDKIINKFLALVQEKSPLMPGPPPKDGITKSFVDQALKQVQQDPAQAAVKDSELSQDNPELGKTLTVETKPSDQEDIPDFGKTFKVDDPQTKPSDLPQIDSDTLAQSEGDVNAESDATTKDELKVTDKQGNSGSCKTPHSSESAMTEPSEQGIPRQERGEKLECDANSTKSDTPETNDIEHETKLDEGNEGGKSTEVEGRQEDNAGAQGIEVAMDT